MWDGSLEYITATERRIELMDYQIKQVHSAVYRTGAKTREFEKAKIDEMLN